MKPYLLLASLMCGGAAYAGCGDNAVLRVDQAAMIFSDTQAELHGAYAWEASPDAWSTHPIGGSERGYVRLSCNASDATCKDDLVRFVNIAGTGKALQFGVPTLKKDVRPGFFSAEGTGPAAETPPWPAIIERSPNRELWNAIQALPPLQSDAGTSTNDAGTGNPRVESDGGTSFEQQPQRGCTIVSGSPLLALGLLFLVLRNRRTQPSRTTFSPTVVAWLWLKPVFSASTFLVVVGSNLRHKREPKQLQKI